MKCKAVGEWAKKREEKEDEELTASSILRGNTAAIDVIPEIYESFINK